MNHPDLDKVYLNYLRTNNIEVIISTTGNGQDAGFRARIAAFNPSIIIASVSHGKDATTQILICRNHIISITPMEEVNIIFNNPKGD